MASLPVHFTYLTGLAGDPFPGVRARLSGSWDRAGRRSEQWTGSDMVRGTAEDGCLCFRATARLDCSGGKDFSWGVEFVDASGRTWWAIPTEIKDSVLRLCHRSFRLDAADQQERYYLTHCRRLGSNKLYRGSADPGIRFAVWAPNAKKVEVVMGSTWDRNRPHQLQKGSIAMKDISGGYLADNGNGSHPDLGPFRMSQVGDGVWETAPDDPGLQDFAKLDHHPYMYRITLDEPAEPVKYRSDLYSRCQVGSGSFNPRGKAYDGLSSDLNGTVSCSAVVDPERVTQYFAEHPPYLPGVERVWPERHFIPQEEFWRGEFGERALPQRPEDLIIYELHVGALGFGKAAAGAIEDAIALLDHLVELGVNTVELLPMAEFGGGSQNWGYSTSHHFAIEYGGGGRDQYKFFVKAAHRRGIAVIMDVVYNHFAHDAERAEWMYDTNAHELNQYYWYIGKPSDYPDWINGYVDNMSTADAPRYHEEMVRKLFISSAAALLHEFHIDGFRVDQTTSIHSYNRQKIPGAPEVPDANIYGAKLLREFGRTLRLLKPALFLFAEDHSEWDQVTLPVSQGGMGFDARWYADFCHHLAGDTDKSRDEYAKLIYSAGLCDNGPLQMDWFAGALGHSGAGCVVYSDSHDEAGNSKGPFYDPDHDPTTKDKEYTSHRGIVVAVNAAPLFGPTRDYAEARCRVAYGLTLFSAATPMLLFGEEVGAERRFKYDAVLSNREDLRALRASTGARLFAFYSGAHRTRLAQRALRSRNIEVVHSHNDNRVIAFRRWEGIEQVLVVASLNNAAFPNGYRIQHPSMSGGGWQEIFNSDAAAYGGANVGNLGATLQADGSGIELVVPANGIVVLQRVS